MGKRDQKPKGGGNGKLIGNIAFFAVAIGVLVFVLVGISDDSDDPIRKMQGDPESAATIYIDRADGFIHDQSPAGDIEKCVTKADWEWLQANHESIFQSQDFANLSAAADPSTMIHASRLVVLKGLVENGPCRKDCEIQSTTIVDDSNAQVIVRQKEFFGDGGYSQYDHRMYLVKEGKYWKVKDFGGGRAVFENRRQPDDVVAVAGGTVLAGGAAAAPTGDPAGLGGDPSTAAPGGATAPAAGAIASEEQADAFVGQARARWEAGDARGAYDNALAAYNYYSQTLGPNHPKTQQTMAMGQKARQALVASGQTP